MSKQAFEKHRASMMGLQSVPGDPTPSLAPTKSRIIATGANAEDIKMGDDDDDEHGMIAYQDEVHDLAGARSSLYDAWTVVFALSLFSVLYGSVTVIAMLIQMVKDGFALLLSAIATGEGVAAYFWDPPVDVHHGDMVLLIREAGA
eukprot:2045354-Rhodomonas_salina.1